MTHYQFHRAYRAARWTLRNRPLADLEIALPSDRHARSVVLAVLAMAGKFSPLYW